jgi:hypothetical protein
MFSKTASEFSEEISKQTESIILGQLNDFVKRGLIVIERQQGTLVMDMENKVTYTQSIRLVLKDKEYIENIEKEIKELKKQISDSGRFVQPIGYAWVNEDKWTNGKHLYCHETRRQAENTCRPGEYQLYEIYGNRIPTL